MIKSKLHFHMGRLMTVKIVLFYTDGNVLREEYRMRGLLNNKNGPALIEYYHDGLGVLLAEYYINGLLHRVNGPAVTWFNDYGEISLQQFCLKGEFLTRDEWYSRLSTEQKVNLLYGKSNE